MQLFTVFITLLEIEKNGIKRDRQRVRQNKRWNNKEIHLNIKDVYNLLKVCRWYLVQRLMAHWNSTTQYIIHTNNTQFLALGRNCINLAVISIKSVLVKICENKDMGLCYWECTNVPVRTLYDRVGRVELPPRSYERWMKACVFNFCFKL